MKAIGVNYYAGIGSRKTPPEVLRMMRSCAKKLSDGFEAPVTDHNPNGKRIYILRSGGAKGADQAFESGVSLRQKKHIYLAKDCTPEAMAFSAKYHPNWKACNDYARKLHGRNAMILLGRDLDTPVDFVLCWTLKPKVLADGIFEYKGGTGQALRIAHDLGIQVFNMINPSWKDEIKEWKAKQ